MFEHRREAIISQREYLQRQFHSVLIACIIVLVALVPGLAGYHWLEGLPWVDSLLNASMILASMGPMDHPQTQAGKLFASGYALFLGIVFVAVATILVAPFAHRLLHRFHVVTESDIEDAGASPNATGASERLR